MSGSHRKSHVGDTALGALAAQDLVDRIASGKVAPNDLLARMRTTLGESASFSHGFSSELLKRIRRMTEATSDATP